MKRVLGKILIAVTVSSTVSFVSAQACSKHPGMTHEQWTSSMANESAKFDAAAKTATERGFTGDFWSRKAAAAAAAPAAGGEEASGSAAPAAPRERQIREVPAN